MAKPGGQEIVAALFGENVRDGRLVGLRCGRAKRQCDFGEPQLEEAIAASRLAVVVTLRHCPRDDLDLAVVEAETSIDGGNLRLDRPLVRQQ